MEILQPGSEITFKGTNVDGIVRSVTISLNDSVTYNVGWWASDNYNINLFMPEELVPRHDRMKSIGFVTPSVFNEVHFLIKEPA